ncbi:YegJ family protein [Marinobacter arenosus]|uniref:YegJ family protein n=1 Tax=Marinobacter arenosus TaxID=2856822 RepID=UPI001C4CD5C2|nr:DUF2314 domain-containing protein [Marinobacter arenosus]MBW0149027.1 DUF2314 domain-containing protein [Marinobacter arenosus]
MKKLSILLILLIAHSAQAGQLDEDEVVWVEGEDPVMIEAIQNARRTLDSFLQKHSDNIPNVESYKLKVMVSDSNGTEHFWVTPFRAIVNGKFEGVLANEPQVVRSVSYGQVIEFDRSMISDWGYVENGRQIGSFTICALFKSMPKEQVEYYKENHGFVCE